MTENNSIKALDELVGGALSNTIVNIEEGDCLETNLEQFGKMTAIASAWEKTKADIAKTDAEREKLEAEKEELKAKKLAEIKRLEIEIAEEEAKRKADKTNLILRVVEVVGALALQGAGVALTYGLNKKVYASALDLEMNDHFATSPVTKKFIDKGSILNISTKK